MGGIVTTSFPFAMGEIRAGALKDPTIRMLLKKGEINLCVACGVGDDKTKGELIKRREIDFDGYTSFQHY